MGSIGHPENWVPYENIKDCSQGFCTMYCPQWCYISYPPPPPFGLSNDDSGTSFSPLVIAIIGILASAFLLVTYYTVISKYCGNMDSIRRRNNRNQTDDSIENENLPNQEPWQVSNSGLDESLIKSITVCKYKRGDGLIEGTDCSVCLSEFQENESLRLLPKCSHAFHVSCIDTWLKSHANCPLCRSNIVCSSPSPLQTLHTLHEIPSDIECEGENHSRNAVDNSTLNMRVQEDDSLRNLLELEEINDTTIEIRDEGIDSQQIRRSISMDSSRVDRLSIADILCINENDESLPAEHNNCIQEGMVSSSKQNLCGINKLVSHQSRVLHCVMSPITMKRSVSSGRYFFNTTRHGKSRINFDLPI